MVKKRDRIIWKNQPSSEERRKVSTVRGGIGEGLENCEGKKRKGPPCSRKQPSDGLENLRSQKSLEKKNRAVWKLISKREAPTMGGAKEDHWVGRKR